MELNESVSQWSNEIDVWISTLGSVPVELCISEDRSEFYEMDCCHVFKLENGKYAVVVESGSSCYDCDDADIELHPDLESAMTAFKKWQVTQ